MNELKALLFDVDGTLADTEKDGHRIAFNMAFEEAGLDWHWSVEDYDWALQVTGGKERMRFFVDERHPNVPEGVDLDVMIPELHAAKTRHYTELLGEGKIPLRPGVERLVREAREQGLRLAIATTTTPANVTALLSNTLGPESVDWFEVIAAGDIVPAKKPAGDIYVWAMDKMNLDADDCIALEDSHNGLLAAHDADLKAVVITVNHYTENHHFNGATTVVDQFGEPDSPLENLSGEAIDGGYVNVAELRRLHSIAVNGK